MDAEQRQVAISAFVEKLQSDCVELLAIAVDDHHFHLLARFSDHRPKHWVGRAKMNASMLLRDVGLPGKVRAVGCRTLPIRDRSHQLNAFDYIVRHRQQGTTVWTFRDIVPQLHKPTANTRLANSQPAVPPTKARGKPATGDRRT